MAIATRNGAFDARGLRTFTRLASAATGTLIAAAFLMRTLPVLLIGVGVVLGACASESAYKVRDANGWPVSTWNARHLDVLVLTCPRTAHTLPVGDRTWADLEARFTDGGVGLRARPADYYTVDGVRVPLVIGVEKRRAYERRFCTSVEPQLPGEPTTVRIALHHQKRVPEIRQVAEFDRSPQPSPTVPTSTPSSHPSSPVGLRGLSASSR